MDYSETIAGTAFIPARLTLSYVKGALPAQITLVNDELVGGSGYLGTVALNVGGQWECGGTDLPATNLQYSPNERATYDGWILAEVVSNASPTVTDAERNRWAFSGVGPVGVGTAGPFDHVHASGPGAVCPAGANVFLYRTSARGIRCT